METVEDLRLFWKKYLGVHWVQAIVGYRSWEVTRSQILCLDEVDHPKGLE